MEPRPQMAIDAGLVACHECGKLHQTERLKEGYDPVCSRCGCPLHGRKPNSVARTWALVIAAIILYIPANVYPIMTVIHFGHGSPATIMGGVKVLFAGGMYGIAILVFFASVVVPGLKLLGLIGLLLSVQLGSSILPSDLTRFYRVVESVGRWSMLDIYVIAVLVALVKLGSVAEITAGPAATSFAAVVVVTMSAAESFDPRLIWDAQKERPRE